MNLISSINEINAELIADFQKAFGSPQNGDPRLAKATTQGVTQATGLVWYDLQTPAKNLFPVITPLRNMIPRVSGDGGTATNWRQVTDVNVGNMQPFVPEGGRGGVLTTAESDKALSYKSLGSENYVTFEANNAAKNFEDIRSTTAQRLLFAAMIQEEFAFLGSNNGVSLSTPTAPTVSTATTGGTIAAATYNVAVVALTLAGYNASSLSGGVVGQVSITPADGGSAYTFGGGSSNKSSTTSQATTGSTSTLSASTPVVNGAVAYAWYVGTAGNEKLEAITTVNSVLLTALAGTGQALSAITANNSQNSYAYDGLMYQAFAASSGAYIKNFATGTPGTGTKLTTDGAGGITEINTYFKDRWDSYRLSPTDLFVNSQELNSISKLVVANGGAPLVRFSGDFGSAAQGLVAGAVVGTIINPFTQNGGQLVKLRLHPNVPAGTILGYTNTLPYPINNVPNVAEYKWRQDWYQLEWPLRTRKYETGVYTDGVLACYFPPALGIINNIAP